MATHTASNHGKFLTTLLSLSFIGTALLLIVLSALLLPAVLPLNLPWQFSRATAVISYLLLSASMIWGLVLSTKISKDLTPGPAVLTIHNAVSWAALGLGVVHPLSLLFDSYFTFNIFHLLIPFIGPYRPLWVGIGVIALYGLLLTTLSFSWKKKIGHKAWRRIHWLTFPTYALVTIHGFMSGTDSPAIGAMYALSTLAVLFLVNYRIIAAGKSKKT